MAHDPRRRVARAGREAQRSYDGVSGAGERRSACRRDIEEENLDLKQPVADLSPDTLYAARQRFDPAGHYHRPELLSLRRTTGA